MSLNSPKLNEEVDEFTSESFSNLFEENQKLTDWPNEPDIGILLQELQSARTYQNSEVLKIEVSRDIYHVRGRWALQKENEEGESNPKSIYQPKMVHKHAEWRFATLSEPFLSTSELFKITPRTMASADSALMHEQIINDQFNNKIDKVFFIDQLVRALVEDGVAFVRVGWDYCEIPRKLKKPIWNYLPATPQEAQIINQAVMDYDNDPQAILNLKDPAIKESIKKTKAIGNPVKAYKIGEEEVEEMTIARNEPELSVVLPENVFVDPSCHGSIDKASFVICTRNTTKGALKSSNIKYHNVDDVVADFSSIANTPDHQPDHYNELPNPIPDKEQITVYDYWGYWDIHQDGKLRPIIATFSTNGVMLRLEESPFPDGKPPFVAIQYSPKKNSIYGTTDAELIVENQMIDGALRRGFIDLFSKSANSQKMLQKGLLDRVNRDRYYKGLDCEFNPGVDPRSAIYQASFPEISQGAFSFLNANKQDAEELTGVKPFQSGAGDPSVGDFASSGLGPLSPSVIRESSIQRRISNGLSKIGQKIIAMNKEFLIDGDNSFLNYAGELEDVDPDALAGDFQVNIEIQTPAQNAVFAKKIMDWLQTSTQFMPHDMVQVVAAEAFKSLGFNAFAKMLRDYKPPQPTPDQMQQQQLKIEQMKAEIAKMQAQAANLQANASRQNAHTAYQTSGLAQQHGANEAKDKVINNSVESIIKSLLSQQDLSKYPPRVKEALIALETYSNMPQGH